MSRDSRENSPIRSQEEVTVDEESKNNLRVKEEGFFVEPASSGQGIVSLENEVSEELENSLDKDSVIEEKFGAESDATKTSEVSVQTDIYADKNGNLVEEVVVSQSDDEEKDGYIKRFQDVSTQTVTKDEFIDVILKGDVEEVSKLADQYQFNSKKDNQDLILTVIMDADRKAYNIVNMAQILAGKLPAEHINFVDKQGDNLLHLVARNNLDPRLIGVLSEAGVDVNALNNDAIGHAPIHIATIQSQSDLITPLVKSGADVNLMVGSGGVPRFKDNALSIALKKPHAKGLFNSGKIKSPETVQALIDNGATAYNKNTQKKLDKFLSKQQDLTTASDSSVATSATSRVLPTAIKAAQEETKEETKESFALNKTQLTMGIKDGDEHNSNDDSFVEVDLGDDATLLQGDDQVKSGCLPRSSPKPSSAAGQLDPSPKKGTGCVMS